MAQTALNGRLTLEQGVWTLVSEVNCTIVHDRGNTHIEVLAMDGAAPSGTDTGIIYEKGDGIDVSEDTLARYPGAGTADRIYAISRYATIDIFVSRAAVA